jgi:hypothetical protein
MNTDAANLPLPVFMDADFRQHDGMGDSADWALGPARRAAVTEKNLALLV